jgi:heme/copper-type cytochrome/quinol oxidase subunit 2
MSLFWLIPVVAILVIVGAIFVSKWIRRSANDDSLFDDDQDEAPANYGLNVKILFVVIPLAALVIWAVLSLIDINAANECKEAVASGSFAPLDGC